MLERWFRLAKNRTTIRQELLGSLATFVTIPYITVVKPRILAEAGTSIEGELFAACVSAAVATRVMGLWANYPTALAPGMSLNAYFSYSVVIDRGITWQTALDLVLLSLAISLPEIASEHRSNKMQENGGHYDFNEWTL